MNTIETLLRRWQDICFLMSRTNAFLRRTGKMEMSSNTGALLNYERIRSYLLSCFQGSEDKCDLNYEDFLIPQDARLLFADEFPLCQTAVSALRYVPNMLMGWTGYSRRIYSLSSDLTLSLAHVSLKDVTWADLHFPFRCYVIELEHSIPSPYGDIDTIWIQLSGLDEKTKKLTTVSITPFTQSLSRLKPLSGMEKKNIRQIVGDEKYFNGSPKLKGKVLSDLSVHLLNRLLNQPIPVQFDLQSDQMVLDAPSTYFPAPEVKDEEYEKGLELHQRFMETLLRIVLGFNMYLRTRKSLNQPKKSADVSMRIDSIDPTAIIFESEVTKIGTEIALSSESREGFSRSVREGRKSGFAQSWHYREGHWRRPPGLGSNPEAEKTVIVLPYMVRVDRMPETPALPSGAQKRV